MSVKQSELCAAWGLSRARVSQLVKDGLPLSSLAEAQAWRVAHYPGQAQHGGSGSMEKNLPTETEGGGLPERPEPAKESDLSREDLIGTLARLKKNEMVAWSMLASAVRQKNETEIMIRMRHYKDASAIRVMQESKVDEILLRRREMLTTGEAKELFGRHLQALRMALKTIPSRMAARCNPSDPELAKLALGEAVDRLFKSMNEWDV